MTGQESNPPAHNRFGHDLAPHSRAPQTSGGAPDNTDFVSNSSGKRNTWPFGTMRPFSYGALLVDPPWHFRNFSGKGEGKNPTAHYQCMSLDDIAALPVAHLAAPDCAMFMWATAPLLPEAIEVMNAWGFVYKSGAAWAKQSTTGAKWAFGTGYVFRSAAEFLIVGTVGQPRVQSRSVRNLIVAPVREHSRKPDSQYEMVEALYAGPYAEIFSRTNRPGWDSWGDEAGKFDEVAA
ncbi:MT-A70 family methyltransferase [Novosphingobium pentaromativorans]|uniref:MT-A70 family protein n=1 Tax=Novosphingobium pentaromativorans US6-1 TaxID=1088721 RepID=G6E7E8_9SPHN|nr:MT-A70 family methyltransferase [Novosphingobium pentaromativorans]AIT81645.1 DNA methyltransferase [Novosphingobium pentaromativorans US6-1]EHJ62771.1 MT-A70 family protein [Novosphingobium pentaromativorans US6-1]